MSTPDTAPTPPPAPLSPVEAALVAEACSKSDLVWVRPPGTARFAAAWHVWHDDAVCLIHGPGEQQLPLGTGAVECVARSKETGAGVVAFVAVAQPPATPEAQVEALAALAKARLNARDPLEQKERWARECTVLLLRPVAVTTALNGDEHQPSGALPPARAATTTVGRLPWHAGGRLRRARRLARRADRPGS